MSEHSSTNRSGLRFQIIPDPETLIEVQLCDRQGLLLTTTCPHEGIAFATFTGSRTCKAHGLLEGELCLVDLSDESAFVDEAIPLGGPTLVSEYDHRGFVPLRAIIARGVSL